VPVARLEMFDDSSVDKLIYTIFTTMKLTTLKRRLVLVQDTIYMLVGVSVHIPHAALHPWGAPLLSSPPPSPDLLLLH
jgi:hypothetical protein